MKAVICPVCNGVGQVSGGFYGRAGDCPTWTSDKTLELCRACNGKGYLFVPEGVYGDYPQGTYHNEPYQDRCPACGGDPNSPAGTGCPMGSHYGTYCEG